MRGYYLQIAYGLNKKRIMLRRNRRAHNTGMTVPDNSLGVFRTSDFCQTSANGFGGRGRSNGEDE